MLSALKSLMFPAVRVEISIDGGEFTTHRARTIVVGNVGYLQAGMPLLPDAAIDDGLLDVVLLHPRRFLSWIPLAFRVLAKRPRTDELVNRMTGRTVVVRAQRGHPPPARRRLDRPRPRAADGVHPRPGAGPRAALRPSLWAWTAAAAQDWLDRYVTAWLTYEADLIGDLFSEDVAYRYHPYDEPVTGRDAVVASWLGDDRPTRPRPAATRAGTFDASYAPVAVDGDVVVATGTSSYRDVPGRTGGQTVFHNCFVMRFDDDGRCREFTEFYMRQAVATQLAVAGSPADPAATKSFCRISTKQQRRGDEGHAPPPIMRDVVERVDEARGGDVRRAGRGRRPVPPG